MVKAADFVHLHVHSDFSLLDGACTVQGLVDKALKSGHKALALTDHGNLCGAPTFYKAAKANNIKPIVGCEVYMAPGKMTERVRGYNHLTLLAANSAGYKNISRLSSLGYRDGFYYKPRIDREALEQYSEGIICLSGCLKGPVSVPIVQGQMDVAKSMATSLHDIFQDNFYLEIQPNDMEEQHKVNNACIDLSRKLGIALAATCDVHYLEPQDAEVQDIKICIGSGKTLTDKNRLKIHASLYYRSTTEVARLFSHVPEAVLNTRAIAEKVNFDFETGTYYLPKFDPPGGLTQEEYFLKSVDQGLRERYGEVQAVHTNRLKMEVNVIRNSGYIAYFLIVADFIQWSRNNGIPVGPGRGSAAGSIVAYALGITNIDPLKYDLLFERFLNPDRVSMPDIDIDFCEAGRGRVIEYVRQKYGESCVTQIITFGTLKAKAVVRDVGRVMAVPLHEVNQLAKLIPEGPKINLKKAFEQEPALGKARQENPTYKELFSYAERLEGLKRHAGKHAAGVVISDVDLLERIPLYRVGGDLATQYTMTEVEEVGLLKMDFLGLRTLTVIAHAERMISERLGQPFKVEDAPIDDRKTFVMMSRGETRGVFQLESSGFRELIAKVKPDRFEDIIALIALYRPGPLGSGMDKLYVDRKHGREPITYEHDSLEPILNETYGAILYQEQVMRIANLVAGFTMAQADVLRKAMGKKKVALMAKFKPRFIDGCHERTGMAKETAGIIWDQIAFFAEYGFNKSHSAAYGLVTYQTGYLKAHYPVEYMAALLTSFRSNLEKMVEYIDECRRMGIEISAPDIRVGQWEFSIKEGRIIYGLEAIKGVGHGAVEAILAARAALTGSFRSIFHFCEEVDVSKCTKAVIEHLIKAGAFDSFNGNRAQHVAVVEEAVSIGAKAQKEKNSNQIGLFGAFEESPEELKKIEETMLPECEEWATIELLNHEKAVLGFYLSSHPLDSDKHLLNRYSTHNSKTLKNAADGQEVVVGGMVQTLRTTIDRKGKRMAFLTIEDTNGTMEAILFGSIFEDVCHEVVTDARIFLRGKADLRRDEPQIIVDDVVPFAKGPDKFRVRVSFDMRVDKTTEATIDDLKKVLHKFSGSDPVQYTFVGKNGERIGPYLIGSHLRVKASRRFEEALQEVIGEHQEIRVRACLDKF
jgi:DNA polymerase III subunit alpha